MGKVSSSKLAVFGVCLLFCGAVLSLVGIATIDWMECSADVAYFNTKHEDLQRRAESKCDVGLWEVCCTDNSDNDCSPYERDVNDWTQVLRIFMVFGVFFLSLSVILMMCLILNDAWRNSDGRRMCASLTFSLGVMMNLPMILAYVLAEYTASDGLWAIAENGTIKYNIGVNLSWSFIVAVIGGVLAPVGVFFICHQWHVEQDREGAAWNKWPTSAAATHNADREFNVDYTNKDVAQF